MSRVGALIVVGVLTAVTPYAGLPVGVRGALTAIFGVIVFCIGVSLRTSVSRGAVGSSVAVSDTPAEPSAI